MAKKYVGEQADILIGDERLKGCTSWELYVGLINKQKININRLVSDEDQDDLLEMGARIEALTLVDGYGNKLTYDCTVTSAVQYEKVGAFPYRVITLEVDNHASEKPEV